MKKRIEHFVNAIQEHQGEGLSFLPDSYFIPFTQNDMVMDVHLVHAAEELLCQMYDSDHALIVNDDPVFYFLTHLLKPAERIMVLEGSSYETKSCGFSVSHCPLTTSVTDIDYDVLAKSLKKEKVKAFVLELDLYPILWDFAKVHQVVTSAGAHLIVSCGTLSGLIPAQLRMNPLEEVALVCGRFQGTLGGVTGGFCLMQDDTYHKYFEKQVSESEHYTSLLDVVCLRYLQYKDAQSYLAQAVANADALAFTLQQEGFSVLGLETNSPFVLVDASKFLGVPIHYIVDVLEKINLFVQPFQGYLKMGVLSVTERGLKERDVAYVAKVFSRALKHSDSNEILEDLRVEVENIACKFPRGDE